MESKIRAALAKARGFTLIELLIVIAIIAILTIAFLPGALKAPAKARDAQRIKAVNDIAAAVESYVAEHNSVVPVSAATPYCLVDATSFSSYFATGYPTDPKPVGNGACDTALKNTSYYYRAFGTTNYAVAAYLEVAAGSNSWLTMSEVKDATKTFVDFKPKVLTTSGGSATSFPADGSGVPLLYIMLGPK